MKNKEVWILLNEIFYLNSLRAKSLLDYFNHQVEAIFDSDPQTLKKIVGEEWANKIQDCEKNQLLDSIQESLEKNQIHIILREDAEFPNLLKEIADPPLLLYAKGEPLHRDFSGFAIVGTRYPTPMGKKLAFDYAQSLSQQRISIVSGLARGIDTSAHQGALNGEGGTIAVLGSGLDGIYPPENKGLSDLITRRGTLVSEFAPGAAPLGAHFPFRNRIISGLSMGVLVVEAQEKSGALITADSALDQNRQVFAIPGRPFDKNSVGCNRLIQMGAKMVLSPQDILEEWGMVFSSSSKEISVHGLSLPPEETQILSQMQHDPLHLDLIFEKNSTIPKDRLQYLLLKLEMKQAIKRLPGNYYILHS